MRATIPHVVCHLNCSNGDNEVTCCGRLFQSQAVATGKAASAMYSVYHTVHATTMKYSVVLFYNFI